MKLLCVIDSLGSGGAQRQLVNIACGLKARGHGVEFFTYYPHDHFKTQLDEAVIPVYVCPKRSRFSLSPLLALRRKMRCGGFDVVLAFLETPSVYAEIASVGLVSFRLVVGERSGVLDGRATISRILKSHLHRIADAVVANSHAHREWMSQRFPFLSPKLYTIWNGIDTGSFHPPEKPAPARHTLRLLGVGRAEGEKNLPRLVAALRLCGQRGCAVTLDWVGRLVDANYYQRTVSCIEENGVQDCWRWLGERKDVPVLMRQYDALILPSLWEGLPNVICEALASGLPAIVSRIADNARLVQEGQSGFLFDPNDPADMAAVLAKFAALDTAARRAMGKAARLFAERELTVENSTVAYENLLLSLAGKQGAAAVKG
jgi:glycosyltransferase involved in cell wall biosynthesis